LRRFGGTPCFQIYGKALPELEWRRIDVFATDRRNAASRWPLWRGTCITWSTEIVVVGADFAKQILHEQALRPASRLNPVVVSGGRIGDTVRRAAAGAKGRATASEILAHECGHTWQALRLGPLYLPLVGSVTLFREGIHFWNHFENEASEQGQFGGLVDGSVHQAQKTG
jgi:hypothetical protein